MAGKQINVSRRQFLQASAATVVATGVPAWFANESAAAEAGASASRRKKFGPNDRINVACIGPGGSKGGYRQGLGDTRHIAGQPGVQVVAVCDVDRKHLEEASNEFGGCSKYTDFREVLDRKDVDAVVIGTPDHWHSYICITAMKAGKDVYCEKPLTLTIDEGKKIVEAWRKTGAVFQTGSQQRSDGRFRLACQLVRNGRIGKITSVETHLPGGPVGGPFAVKPVPEDLDWDMWLGPAAKVDYVPERTHGTFRWWLEYSGGMLTDWGAHHNDIAQWGLGTDRSGPVSVEAIGRGPMIGPNCYNTFPNFEVHYTYANGIPLIASDQGENGVQFNGEGGWIFVSRSKISASDQRLIDDPLPSGADLLYVSNDHAANFVDCMRSRKQPICDAEIGHRSVSVCHLANISLRLGGRKLRWDPVKEIFPGDEEANRLLKRESRKPWRV